MSYLPAFSGSIPYLNKHFQVIVDFYLFNCPVKNTSRRGKTFEDYGWIGSPKFSTLKSRLLKAATAKLPYHPCTKTELSTMFGDLSSIDPPGEFCVFLKHEERDVLPSLFSAIRNAFAHGSFQKQTVYHKPSKRKITVYYFENYDGYMKAKIALREETLMAWIDIITAGP